MQTKIFYLYWMNKGNKDVSTYSSYMANKALSSRKEH